MKRREILQGTAGLLAGITAADGAAKASMADNARRARGLKTLEQATGTSGRAVVDSLADMAPELGEFIVDFAYGDVIGRTGMDLKTRELATVSALAALGNAHPQLKVHIRGALNVGASRAEIIEILLQTAVYAGFPAALNAVTSAREAFAEAGV